MGIPCGHTVWFRWPVRKFRRSLWRGTLWESSLEDVELGRTCALNTGKFQPDEKLKGTTGRSRSH